MLKAGITCAGSDGVQRHAAADRNRGKSGSPDHERIASGNNQSESTRSRLKELKTNSLSSTGSCLLWRNHRFQGARKSAECRSETRDGPGHRGSLSNATESNQLGRHLLIFDAPSCSWLKGKIYCESTLLSGCARSNCSRNINHSSRDHRMFFFQQELYEPFDLCDV